MSAQYSGSGRSGIDAWLTLGLALAILGGLIFLNLQFEHDRTANREEDRLSVQARVIAENMEQQLASVDHALLSIRGDLSHSEASPRFSHLRQHIVSLSKAMPGIRTLSVLDENGKVLASNRPELVGVDLKQRSYFQEIRQHADPLKLYVSPPFKTVLGVFALNVSRMIPGPRGEFAGIVSATLDPEYFKTLMSSVLYARDMWDALAHGDGRLFLMMPTQKAPSGMNLAQPGSFFVRHRDSGKTATVFTGTVLATGENRMMAQRTVNPPSLELSQPLVVAVSRDLHAIFQPWLRNVASQVILFGVIMLSSILGLHSYQRHRRRLEREAAEARTAARRFSTALDHISALIYIKDRQRRYVYANRPTLELFKISANELPGSDDTRFFPPGTVAQLHDIDTRVLAHGEDTAEEVTVQDTDGSRRVYWEIKTPIYDDKSGVCGICGISTDITERKDLLDKLAQQATKDYLTGLSNRRYFMERGEAELAHARRYGHALSLLMIDIDHFKNINDTHGHKVGDIVLQQQANIMRSTFRTVDTIGRIGGEEFAVLLPETALQEAVIVAERLRQAVASADLAQATGLPLHFTISIGVAMLPSKEASLDSLLILADTALYKAKQAGRNRICAQPDSSGD